MNPSSNILPRLFDQLEATDISYAVLRGFEALPQQYSNDIDFGVLKSDLTAFIEVLQSIGAEFAYRLTIRDLRHEVIKLSLIDANNSIDIDIWTAFNYAGLIYLTQADLINNYRYHNKIKVLKPENELSLSFLKELLHMSRLRADKVDGLKEKLPSLKDQPLSTYFDAELIAEFKQVIEKEKFSLPGLARKAKLRLFSQNLKIHGVWNTLSAILTFFYIRLNKRKYIAEWENAFQNMEKPVPIKQD